MIACQESCKLFLIAILNNPIIRIKDKKSQLLLFCNEWLLTEGSLYKIFNFIDINYKFLFKAILIFNIMNSKNSIKYDIFYVNLFSSIY